MNTTQLVGIFVAVVVLLLAAVVAAVAVREAYKRRRARKTLLGVAETTRTLSARSRQRGTEKDA